MKNISILNTREIKKITDLLKDQFGYTEKLSYAFIQSSKGKLFMINKNLGKINFKKLRIDKWGMYFGTRQEDGLRLSMEGAQLIGKKARKNVVELNKEELQQYFQGEDVEKKCEVESNSYIILKYHNDIIGCAKYKNKIYNYLPKIHRTNELVIE